jgi:streptogramin lyase
MTPRHLFLPALLAASSPVSATAVPPALDPPRSSAWLSRLPDGELKRRFILDCTGCHQFNEKITRPDGKPRSETGWADAVTRMLGYAGASSSFPVIAEGRDPRATAAWLARHLDARDVPDIALPAAAKATITEYALPEPKDLPHDVAVEASGTVLVTGMFTDRVYRLDPATAAFGEIPIPVEHANPRAIELDPAGHPWVVLGAPGRLATVGADSQWRSYGVGMYPHSLAIAPDGKVWFNGHFTRDPELIGRVDPAAGTVQTHQIPSHPTLGSRPGGPIPYELRAGADGRIWMSELQGNRIVAFTPSTGKFQTFTLPRPYSGPRRFDLDAKGIVWIPAYAANRLVRLDPASGRFTEIELPIRDAVPYVVRVDPRDGSLWIGTSAADVLLRYRPAAAQFDVYPLPSHGALVRHLAVDGKRGVVWVAYGASPGIPARIARVQPE